MASQDVRGSYACPLCAEDLLPMASFEKHVGRHLEELSLFVLPRGTEDDEVLDDESGNDEPEHGESDSGQETESGAKLGEDDDIFMTLNGKTMCFPKGSLGGKTISVRAGENGTLTLDVKRPSGRDDAATKATGLDPYVVAPEGAEEPETRGRRMSTGGSSNVERHPRARDRARSRQAAPASASPPRTQRLRQALDHLRPQEEIDRRTDLEDLSLQEEIERLEPSEHQLQFLERLEAAESKSSENEEMKRPRLEVAEEYQRAIEEEALRAQFEEKFRKEEEERIAKERKMKQAAIEEWKLAEIKRRENELNEFKEHLRDEFGYTEEETERIVRKRAETSKKDKGRDEDEQQRRDTWIKVHRKYLLPDTLMAYHLPWDWDENDGNYIIIKQWIAEDMQEELFAHTRRIREGH